MRKCCAGIVAQSADALPDASDGRCMLWDRDLAISLGNNQVPSKWMEKFFAATDQADRHGGDHDQHRLCRSRSCRSLVEEGSIPTGPISSGPQYETQLASPHRRVGAVDRTPDARRGPSRFPPAPIYERPCETPERCTAHLRVVGLARLAADIPPDLALATIGFDQCPRRAPGAARGPGCAERAHYVTAEADNERQDRMKHDFRDGHAPVAWNRRAREIPGGDTHDTGLP